MSQRSSSGPEQKSGLSPLLILTAVLLVVLGGLFFTSFKPGWTLFLNDGPLGALKADYNKTPEAFFGVWQDLNWVGSHGGSLLPSFTFGQFFLLGPVFYSKFHALVALFGLGIAAWYSCRLLGFSPLVGVLTGIAAALNMNVFSNACWGLSSRPWALATSMLAVGLISTRSSNNFWIRCALAGLAVGMGITEGADVGIIFSVFIGAYVFVHALVTAEPGARGSTVGIGIAKVIVVAGFAGFMAFNIIDALVFRAKVMDAVESQKQAMAPEQSWDWATQWSLPKAESLRVIIPGLHGYRMDTPDGGRYWGTAGRDPHWEETHQGYPRFSGAGEYAGVTVVLIAVFGFCQALRRKGSVYTRSESILIYFWAAVVVISLLCAWGRYGSFYRIVYALPVFSNIRNPIKWTHPMHLGILMLFAYGLEALWRGYFQTTNSNNNTAAKKSFGEFWAKATTFDKRWVYGCAAFVVLSGLGWLLYLTSLGDLTRYLSENAIVNRGEAADSVIKQVAAPSQFEVVLYLVFLVLSVVVLVGAMSGRLAGSKGQVAALLLGLLIVVDLWRANKPWIQHYDYVAKYATTPLLDYLRSQPGHSRVTVAPFAGKGLESLQMLQQIYHVEWMQQQFQFYNIPSVDIIQDPRPLPENSAFKAALERKHLIRFWELTGCRYVFGLGGQFADLLNQQVDGNQGRFRTVMSFDAFNEPENRIGITTNDVGPYALLEFKGALPRATLFTQWEYLSSDEEMLNRLADPAFKPAERVIVAGNSTNAPAPSATPVPATAEITSYAPKKMVIKTESANAGVLALTDKYNTDWQVTVDGRPAELLRCNFLMRGVKVPSGTHTVEFRFEPSTKALYISLAAIGTAIVLAGILAVTSRRSPSAS